MIVSGLEQDSALLRLMQNKVRALQITLQFKQEPRFDLRCQTNITFNFPYIKSAYLRFECLAPSYPLFIRLGLHASLGESILSVIRCSFMSWILKGGIKTCRCEPHLKISQASFITFLPACLVVASRILHSRVHWRVANNSLGVKSCLLRQSLLEMNNNLSPNCMMRRKITISPRKR